MGLIILLVVLVLAIAALPRWSYSCGWNYYPTGGLGLLFLVIIIVLCGLLATTLR